uniref:hypothetical protein n=1 Tax=Mariniflexile sp. TaxID=1979402 RepID=UPI004047E0CF
KSLKLINQINITENFINDNSFTLLEDSKLAKESPYINEIKIHDSTYYITHYFVGNRIIKWLRQLEEENPTRKILLISNDKINKGISNHFNKDLVKVIRFKNEKKFIKKMEAYFFGNNENENIETT